MTSQPGRFKPSNNVPVLNIYRVNVFYIGPALIQGLASVFCSDTTLLRQELDRPDFWDGYIAKLKSFHLFHTVFYDRIKCPAYFRFLACVLLSISIFSFIWPFNHQVIYFEFPHTSSCVSLVRSTISSEWKLFILDNMGVNCSWLIYVMFYLQRV